MELRILRYFLETAEKENITKAAEALHITQPALSRQLADLEEELGTKLFIRGKRKTILTEEGRLLRKRAEEIADLISKTEQEVKEGSAITGDIHIGCAVTEGMRFLFRLVKTIEAAHPLVTVHLYDGNDADVLEKLDQGLLDFGVLCSSDKLKKYGYLALPHKDTWCALMKADSPLAAKGAVTPADLRKSPLILSRQEMGSGTLSHWFHADVKTLRIAGTFNLLGSAIYMVEEGLGTAITFAGLVNTEGTGLTTRPLSPAVTSSTYFIWKRSQLFSKAPALLKGMVEKAVQGR